ncbi:hypothetical protein [Arthrobacter sp. MDT1-65]
MATKAPKTGFAQPAEFIASRVRFASSGAAGVHADQKARKHHTGQTNRIGSRSACVRSALRMEDR